MGTRRLLPLTLTLLVLFLQPGLLNAQQPVPSPSEPTALTAREILHAGSEWQLIEPHLPNPKTASAAQLENAAAVLRARRFYDDALDYYRFAADRGGNLAHLLNCMGVTELELRQPAIAHVYFQRALGLEPRNPQFWNNLAAADFLGGSARAALSNYSKAVKLDKRNAVFHSNLGTTYFELKDFESARKQFEDAFRLDPQLYQKQDGAGIEARIFSPTDHGRFCFEMARVAALRHDDPTVISWLSKASDSGYDIRSQIAADSAFAVYRTDPRIRIMVQNARALRAGRVAVAAPIPPLTAGPDTSLGGAR